MTLFSDTLELARDHLETGSKVVVMVEATMEMETTLRLAVSVRDRLVEAYQQIMQMPI